MGVMGVHEVARYKSRREILGLFLPKQEEEGPERPQTSEEHHPRPVIQEVAQGPLPAVSVCLHPPWLPYGASSQCKPEG